METFEYKSEYCEDRISYNIKGQLRARDVPNEDETDYNFAYTSLGSYFCYPVHAVDTKPQSDQLERYCQEVISFGRPLGNLPDKEILHIKSGGIYRVVGWCWSMLHEEWFVLYQGREEKPQGIWRYIRSLDNINKKFVVQR